MARKRGQKAHVRRKGPSWMTDWWEDVKLVDGKMDRHRFFRVIGPAAGPGALSKREAVRLADKLIFSKLDQVSLRPGSLLTVAQFVRERYEPQVVEKKRSDHLRLLLKNHVIPEFGDRRLRDIRRDDIQSFLLEKAKTLSPQTVKHIRNVLHSIFKHAKRLEFFVGEYPTEFVEIPSVEKNPRHELDREQAYRLIARAPAAGVYHWMRVLLLLLTSLGLRIGEACGLRWKRLNLTGETVMIDGEPVPPYYLTVRENYIWRTGGPRHAPLKSRKSRRNIPLPPELVAILIELRGNSKFVGPDDPVFAGETGRPFDHRRVVARVLKPLGKTLGMEWVSWHCLRHSASSFGEQRGMAESERQSVLGHADAAMTRHYTHAEETRVRDGLAKVVEMLLSEPPNSFGAPGGAAAAQAAPKKGPAKAKVLKFPERKEGVG